MLSFYLSLVLTDDDRNKVTEIYIRFYPVMMFVAEQKLANKKDLAGDVVHDAMLKIIDNLDMLDLSDDKKIRNLCITIVKNKCCDCLRSKDSDVVSLDEQFDIPDDIQVEDIVVSEDNVNHIVNVIKDLDEKYIYVCLLKFVHGYSEKEISKLLDVNYSTVRSRIERARRKLMISLKEELK